MEDGNIDEQLWKNWSREKEIKMEGLSKYLELGVVTVNGKSVRGSSSQSKGELGKWSFHK